MNILKSSAIALVLLAAMLPFWLALVALFVAALIATREGGEWNNGEEEVQRR